MSNRKNKTSIWEESMRVGLPEFDEERKELTHRIEHLDLSPLCRITDESFLTKFRLFEASVIAFFTHEEALFTEFQVPANITRTHLLEHGRVLEIFANVYMDSMNKRNQTAIDVYQMLKNEMRRHISDFGQDLCKYIPDKVADCRYGQPGFREGQLGANGRLPSESVMR